MKCRTHEPGICRSNMLFIACKKSGSISVDICCCYFERGESCPELASGKEASGGAFRLSQTMNHGDKSHNKFGRWQICWKTSRLCVDFLLGAASFIAGATHFAPASQPGSRTPLPMRLVSESPRSSRHLSARASRRFTISGCRPTTLVVSLTSPSRS